MLVGEEHCVTTLITAAKETSVSIVFSHLSKLSHGNLRFAPGLKLSM